MTAIINTWRVQKQKMGEVWETAARGNALMLTATTFFGWTVFFAYTPTYLPLYYLAKGLPSEHVGYLASAAWSVALVGSLFSGILAKRLRHVMRFVCVMDCIAFVLPPIIWVFATRPWHFWLAAFCTGAWGFNVAGFNMLLTAGVERNDLPRIFTFRMVAQNGAGFLAPFIGLLLLRHHLVPLSQAVLLLSAAITFANILYRAKYIKEGPKPEVKEKGLGLLDFLRIPQQEPEALVVLLVLWLVVSFCMNLNGAYASLFFTNSSKGLGLSEASISLLPGLGSVVSILFTLLVAPHFKDGHTTFLWRASFLGMGVYSLALALAPSGSLSWICISSVLGAASYLIAGALIGSTAISLASPPNREHVIALSSVFAAVAAMPAGSVASWLYHAWPRLPFLVAGTLHVVVWAVSLRYLFHHQAAEEKKLSH